MLGIILNVFVNKHIQLCKIGIYGQPWLRDQKENESTVQAYSRKYTQTEKSLLKTEANLNF